MNIVQDLKKNIQCLINSKKSKPEYIKGDTKYKTKYQTRYLPGETKYISGQAPIINQTQSNENDFVKYLIFGILLFAIGFVIIYIMRNLKSISQDNVNKDKINNEQKQKIEDLKKKFNEQEDNLKDYEKKLSIKDNKLKRANQQIVEYDTILSENESIIQEKNKEIKDLQNKKCKETPKKKIPKKKIPKKNIKKPESNSPEFKSEETDSIFNLFDDICSNENNEHLTCFL